jgi:hypothetical protein
MRLFAEVPPMLLTVFLVLAADLFASVVPPDTMDVDHARNLSGHRVRVSMTSAKPTDYHFGKTIVGCADRPDRVERSAHLKGERYDAEKKNLLVTGTLTVIDHEGRIIDKQFVPAWTEIRIEE